MNSEKSQNVPNTPQTRVRRPRKRITQAELEEFRRLQIEEVKLEVLRQDLIDRLQNGARIELGILIAEVKENSFREFWLDRVAAILGRKGAIELCDAVAPKMQSFLFVRERRKRNYETI